MGFLSNLTSGLGLSGSRQAGGDASRQLFQIGENLRNFTPLRVRSAAGTGTYDKSGLSFNLDPRLNAAAGSGMDFFGNLMSKLAAFDEGDATNRTLSLLRARRAPQFGSQLGSLESRLLQQGRLGLGTGARGENPEMASFFGAEAMADLESQLLASEEARRERAGLLEGAGQGIQLAMEASMPSQFMSGLFNAESLRASRDIAAANVAAGGPKLQYAGAEADRGARADFFGNLISGAFGMPQTPK
jgi:hypothetical protein